MKRAARAAELIRRCLMLGVVLLLTIASTSVAADAPAKPPGSLADNRCYVCHSDREAMVGPAFAEIAAYYRGNPDAVSKIAVEIRAGIRSGSPWHMPPHPEVSPSEARAMARYILSLDPKVASPQEVNRR